MADWHISLHACDTKAFPTKELKWHDVSYQSIDAGADQLSTPFPISFDEFIGQVNELGGGYAEGDGSYGVCGPDGAWKIVGNIYEVADAMHYVEMMGSCPDEQLLNFVRMLGVEPDGCAVQVMQGGFYVSVVEFLKSGSQARAN